jgi:hypothetical protein
MARRAPGCCRRAAGDEFPAHAAARDRHLARGLIDRVEGRKVWTRGRLLDDQDGVFAEGEALYVVLELEKLRPLIEKLAAEQGVDPETLLRS